jgi:hypothetical protein
MGRGGIGRGERREGGEKGGGREERVRTDAAFCIWLFCSPLYICLIA